MSGINERLNSPKGFALPFSPSLKTREAIAAYIFLAPFLIFFLIFFVRAAVASVQFSFLDWRLLFCGWRLYVRKPAAKA